MPSAGSTCAPTCAVTSRRSPGRGCSITHDPIDAVVLADRLVILEDGPHHPDRHHCRRRRPAPFALRRRSGRHQPAPRHSHRRPHRATRQRRRAHDGRSAPQRRPRDRRPSPSRRPAPPPARRQSPQRLGSDGRIRRRRPRQGAGPPRRPDRPHRRSHARGGRRARSSTWATSVGIDQGRRPRRLPAVRTLMG